MSKLPITLSVDLYPSRSIGWYSGEQLLRAGRDASTSMLSLWQCLSGVTGHFVVDVRQLLAQIGEPHQVRHFDQQWERFAKLGIETELARFRGTDEPFARTQWVDLPYTQEVVDSFLLLGDVVYGPESVTYIKWNRAKHPTLLNDSLIQVPIPYPDGPAIFWPDELRP